MSERSTRYAIDEVREMLRELRHAKGWGRVRLAEETVLSVAAGVELGRSGVSVSRFLRLRRALQIAARSANRVWV